MISERTKVSVRSLYDVQKLRIQLQLRIAELIRDGKMTEEEAKRHYNVSLAKMQEAEKAMEKAMWLEIRDMKIVDLYLIRIKGIGPRLAGLLVGNIAPIDRFDTISKLWAYCGLHVIDGRAVKRTKGQKANWSSELKTTAWKIAQSMVKIPDSPYREVYDQYKARITEREITAGKVVWGSKGCWLGTGTADDEQRHRERRYTPVHYRDDVTPPEKAPKDPEWTLGRINNMALRYIAKKLLSHLWLVWREMENLPVRPPYVLEQGGHTTADDPWAFVTEAEPVTA